MDNQITLKDIIKTEAELRNMGYGVKNDIIEKVDVNTIAHFGNATCLEIMCSNICPMSGYNNTGNLGFIIRALIELLDLSQEDGLRLSKIKHIPCRLVFNEPECRWGSSAIGIGNFMKDKFVLIKDLARINN